jgi:membrane protein implicated in regulation of membrane protease activity
MRAGDVTAVSSNTLDVGGMVTLESWIDAAAGSARVRYRDAIWEARVAPPPAGQAAPAPGAVLYIRNVAGSVLEVSPGR